LSHTESKCGTFAQDAEKRLSFTAPRSPGFNHKKGLKKMLVLTRGVNEEIIIATSQGEIRVMVADLRHGKARLGITAPTDIPVHRKEVWDAIIKNGENPLSKRKES